VFNFATKLVLWQKCQLWQKWQNVAYGKNGKIWHMAKMAKLAKIGKMWHMAKMSIMEKHYLLLVVEDAEGNNWFLT
jgi:hypothetical protein